MKVKGVDATYYTVRDLEKQTSFYSRLFGAAPDMEWDGRLSEWTFQDGSSFGLYRTEEAGNEPLSGGSVMFAVDDVAAAVAEAKQFGMKVNEHEGDSVMETPGCHMAFCQDLEGNHFILHHLKEACSNGK